MMSLDGGGKPMQAQGEHVNCTQAWNQTCVLLVVTPQCLPLCCCAGHHCEVILIIKHMICMEHALRLLLLCSKVKKAIDTFHLVTGLPCTSCSRLSTVLSAMIQGAHNYEGFVVKDYSEDDMENVLEEFFIGLKRTTKA
uniref:Uncharacterized protein n=1 Tax=Echeneis naucrates TaxID=173247 RepID=A0A665WX99_ECHNA